MKDDMTDATAFVSQALREHGMAHIKGTPEDEYDCCADVAIAAYQYFEYEKQQEDKSEEVKIEEVTCHTCGNVIPRQWPDHPTATNLNNDLTVEFHGGYGSFTDCIYNCPAERIVLCHQCAHYLCEFLDINPNNWHTHIPDTGQHPDHHTIRPDMKPNWINK